MNAMDRNLNPDTIIPPMPDQPNDTIDDLITDLDIALKYGNVLERAAALEKVWPKLRPMIVEARDA